jgi:hypothetical protein
MNLQDKPQETIFQDDANDRPTLTTSNTGLSSPSAVQVTRKKSLAFCLTFVAVLINLFLYALDATTLAVATPVSHPEFCLFTGQS